MLMMYFVDTYDYYMAQECPVQHFTCCKDYILVVGHCYRKFYLIFHVLNVFSKFLFFLKIFSKSIVMLNCYSK